MSPGAPASGATVSWPVAVPANGAFGFCAPESPPVGLCTFTLVGGFGFCTFTFVGGFGFCTFTFVGGFGFWIWTLVGGFGFWIWTLVGGFGFCTVTWPPLVQ